MIFKMAMPAVMALLWLVALINLVSSQQFLESYPRIDNQLSSSDVIVMEGRSLHLACFGKSISPIQIQWQTGTGNCTMLRFPDIQEIVALTGITPECSGNYICSVTDVDGAAVFDSQPINVRVHYRPKFIIPDTMVEAKFGETVTLTMFVATYPDLESFFWQKNNDSLSRSSRAARKFRLRKTTDHYSDHKVVYKVSLTIHNVDYLDSGEYSYTAANYLGSTQGIIKLKVIYRDCQATNLALTHVCSSNTMAAFPNILGHSSPQQAEEALEDHLVGLGLDSHAAIGFLCLAFFPPCMDINQPCRSSCMYVQKEMEDTVTSLPPSLNCAVLPDDPTQCISVNTPDTCSALTVGKCAALNYNTRFPNMFNHGSQAQAHMVSNALLERNTQCSPYLVPFMCTSFFPKCMEDNNIVTPCRSVCESILESCKEEFKEVLGSFSCNMFPDEECTDISFIESLQSKEQAVTTTCNDLEIQLCSDLGYDMTIMPNFFGHSDQNDAAIALGAWSPLIKINCSPDLKPFLCSLYAPTCKNGKVNLPTKSLCESARDGCALLLQKFGFDWPNEIHCEQFKDIMDQASHQCMNLQVEYCSGLGYTLTSLPNRFNHTSQENIDFELKQYALLIETDCSPHLKSFLCSMYTPECNQGNVALPDKTTCETVKQECLPIMMTYGIEWPDILNCDLLEDDGQSETDEILLEPTQKCQDLEVSQCMNLGYNMTLFPNFYNHTSQDEAATELSNWDPLLNYGCSSELLGFLCSVLAPPCTQNNVINPDPEKCMAARDSCEPIMNTFGYEWPSPLKCEMFRGQHHHVNENQETKSDCIQMEIPFCEGIGYDLISLPNRFNQDSQETISQMLQNYQPLVDINCSPDLRSFLCSMFAPQCPIGSTAKPDHSTCLSVKQNCLPIMEQYGFNWPENLNCENLANQYVTTTQNVVINNEEKCQKLEVSQCMNLGYNMTLFPNFYNHTSQDEAATELSNWNPLLSYGCSSELLGFLCSVLAPPCTQINVILPDPEKCMAARDNCEPIMNTFGYEWPSPLKCEMFKGQHGHVNENQENNSDCIQMEIPFCEGIGYDFISLPNRFNQDSQETISQMLQNYQPLVDINCSPDLKSFLCSMFAPQCPIGSTAKPDHSTCLSVKQNCLPIMEQYGFNWPENLNCENLANQYVTTTQNVFINNEEKCQKLEVSQCMNLGYNMTFFPNFYNHTSQDEAATELSNWDPLLSYGCSSELLGFLCSVLAPPCTQNNVILPDPEKCMAARDSCEPIMNTFGYEWPSPLKCEMFKGLHEANKDHVQAVHNTGMYTCEPLKVYICLDLGYTMTALPNHFNHTSQENAGIDLHQWFPLIQQGCSPDLKIFLCSLFAPACYDNHVVPPERKRCIAAKAGCETLMHRYGYMWPETFNCEKFL